MSKFQQSAHPVQCTITKSAVLKVVDTAPVVTPKLSVHAITLTRRSLMKEVQ